MTNDNLRYVITRNGVPTHKYADGGKTAVEVEKSSDVSLIIPEGIVVLEIIGKDDADKAMAIIKDDRICCRATKAYNMGIYVWFAATAGDKCYDKQELSSGIVASCKVGGKNKLIEIRRGGNPYPVLIDNPFDDLDCVPDTFRAVATEKKDDKDKFKKNLVGRALMENNYIICSRGKLYIYDDGYYKDGDKIINAKMVDLRDDILIHQKKEVIDYIKCKADVDEEKVEEAEYIVNVKNGRYDLKTGKLSEHTPAAIDFCRLPVVYSPNAYCEAVDNMLDRVMCNDKSLRAIFEEMMGLVIIKNCAMQVLFFLHSDGSNGKSTVLDMLKQFVGKANYTDMDIKEMTEGYNLAMLENKLANIGDDVDYSTLTNTGKIKKAVAGNSMMVREIYESPHSMQSYATHIYSCNRLPRSMDKSYGYFRRYVLIPFNAVFGKNDPDYDPMISYRISTDEAMSYLFNLAIMGAERVIKNGRLTQSDASDKLLESYITDNSTTLTWVTEECINEDYLLDTPRDEIYDTFVDWCKQSSVRFGNIPGKKTFFSELIKKYKFASQPKQKTGGKRYFVQDINNILA